MICCLINSSACRENLANACCEDLGWILRYRTLYKQRDCQYFSLLLDENLKKLIQLTLHRIFFVTFCIILTEIVYKQSFYKLRNVDVATFLCRTVPLRMAIVFTDHCAPFINQRGASGGSRGLPSLPTPLSHFPAFLVSLYHFRLF